MPCVQMARRMVAIVVVQACHWTPPSQLLTRLRNEGPILPQVPVRIVDLHRRAVLLVTQLVTRCSGCDAMQGRKTDLMLLWERAALQASRCGLL